MSDDLLDQLPIWLHALTVLAILCLGIIIRLRPNRCRHYEFSKRFFRFSLRTLLIAMTLIAVILGAIVYAPK
jgi:hypothetical protein